jgi:peptidoglycan/xylan/chitin deacetylase (PgdA/CDA1 family)
MRTAVICTQDNVFNRRVLPAHVATFGELVGIVAVRDPRKNLWVRAKREWKRSRWRLLDVLAFRAFYRARFARSDRALIRARAEAELNDVPAPPDVPVHETDDPNSEQTREFLESVRPDLTVAACKTLLRPEIFNVPEHGTFVVHPGICPEYRNAHGCFWALARRDLGRVGATLLRIDEGIDTGPVYGYYRTEFDEHSESHVLIQLRSVYDNIGQIGRDLVRVYEGQADPIDVSGRPSAVWGQPRLTDYVRWKRGARRGSIVLLYHDIVSADARDEAGFAGPLAGRYKLDPQLFEKHLDAVAATGVEVGLIHSDQPRPEVALSFDDGGSSALVAAAALEERGWRGHFFIPTMYIGKTGFLRAEEVRELAARGHVIGSHSHTHPSYMGKLPRERIENEWRRSRAVLTEVLGEEPVAASVPGGYLSRHVLECAREAGFRLLMTSEPSSKVMLLDNLVVQGRYSIWADTPAARAAAYASGRRTAQRRLWLEWKAKKLAKRISPGLYEGARHARARSA